MPSNFTGDPNAAQSPSPAPGPGVAPIVADPSDGDGLNAASVAQAFKTLACFSAYAAFQHSYCDGSDGSVTLDGVATVPWASLAGSTYTMTRDTSLLDLTVNTGIKIITAGFRLIGKGVLTTADANQISNSGGAGGNFISSSGGTAGAAAPAGTLAGSAAGGSGGNSGNNGNAGSAIASGNGGAGGAGHLGLTHTGGAGGTVTSAPAARGNAATMFDAPGGLGYILGLNSGTPILTAIGGGAGGGGGGGEATGGGGGGGGGGVLVVAFRKLALAHAGDIQVAGGNGGNGNGGSPDSGAGGGGGGGVLYLMYKQKPTGMTFSAATNCPGGAGGSSTSGAGVTGSNGSLYDYGP